MNGVVQHVSNITNGVSLSSAAKQHLLKFLNENKNYLGVRFSVKKTGCSGLSYVVDYVSETQEQDVTFSLEGNYQVYIDKASYPFLNGMSVDYVKEGLNSKFVFTNPNQTGQCGCGESFTVSSLP